MAGQKPEGLGVGLCLHLGWEPDPIDPGVTLTDSTEPLILALGCFVSPLFGLLEGERFIRSSSESSFASDVDKSYAFTAPPL